MSEQVQVSSFLDDPPALEHHDVVGEIQGIRVLVRDHHGCELQLRQDVAEFAHDLPPGLNVER